MSNAQNCIHFDYGRTCPTAYGAFCDLDQCPVDCRCSESCRNYTTMNREQQRLSAVRALVLEYGAADSPAIEALAAVWPEAVKGVR